MRKIAIIPGDGIGPEVLGSAERVLDAVGFTYEPIRAEAGFAAYKKYGSALPTETLNAVRETDAILFGAVTTPPGIKEYQSAIVGLRQALDLYANVRPARSYDTRNINLTIVRENTEGLYIGEEHRLDDVAVATRRITTKGSKRISEYAYQYAKQNEKTQVTIAHKANVLRETCGLFREVALDVAKQYPEITTEERLADACAMEMILEPERFQVILTTNLFGDILSDVTAGLIGSIGLLPSANIGAEHALFEPVHGSAPDIAGKGIANPAATLFSAALMLRHLNEPEKAQRVESAVETTMQQHKTADLGGNVNTEAFTNAVIQTLT